ncbi:hypothetical protein [Pseudolysinimonas sp.]|uniref:hypothetical protein n=1 Tax=Pseudolysinimonas sp. TaxID=2680009 RepID=UPI00286C4112|nr:hypothetical protein [Pseudolysinimonas sp.]
MTLSGNSDWKDRAQAAREGRRARQEASDAKRPWLFPLIVGLAVAAILVAVYLVTIGGVGV